MPVVEDQHVTKIVEDLDPDTPTGHVYQARCSCHWWGTSTFNRKRAVHEADVHRAKEVVDAL
jgi:hypothetical protein